MIENLINHFSRHTKLDDNEIDFLRNNSVIKDFTKNQMLLREGEISKQFFFVIKGCVRLFYLANAEEKTAFFYTENMFVSSYESFTKQKPAQHNLQIIEDSILVIFSLESVAKFLQFSPKFESLARIMMEEELAVYQQIISSFITLNAEQRYIKLLKDHPELMQRIPQHQIATFLGVSAETLSRIRKRIASNN